MTGRVPRLEAGGLSFRPWRDTDAPAVLELARDPLASRWMPTLRLVRDLESARGWLRARHDDDRVDWAVSDPATDALAGRVGLHHFSTGRGAQIGYAVWPAHRGKGVAALMVTTAVGHAFGSMSLVRLSLTHATGNPASCAVATRCGFAYEGLERSSFDHGDGVLHDMHRHARLASDPPGPAPATPRALEPVTLRAGSLVIRPWAERDAQAVLEGLADPLAVRWNPRLPLPDLAAARGWIAQRAARWASGQAATWAVTDHGTVVGSVALRELNRVDAFAVTSYWTMPAARGRGVAGRALARAKAYALEELGMHRVQLGHAVANRASCRVAEKAGFRLEGTARGSYRLAGGFADEHVHARVAGDPGPGRGVDR